MAASVFACVAEAETAELRAWPVLGVLATFRLWSETEITFDIDLGELQGQPGVDTALRFLQAIRSRLGKPDCR